MAKKSRSTKRKQPADSSQSLNLGELQTIVDPNIKTVWVDRMQLFLRTDSIATLAFATLVPPGQLIESGRFQTNVSLLRSIVDVLCRHIDYYPTKGTKA